jgi:hypothetical protein
MIRVYKGYYINIINNGVYVFETLQDVREVNPVFSAPKYYMALGWIDNQVLSSAGSSSSTFTVDYRNEIEKNVDYQMQLQKDRKHEATELKNASGVADIGIRELLMHQSIRVYFRNFLIECELFSKNLTTTKNTSAAIMGVPIPILNKSYSSIKHIEHYLRYKKYNHNDINAAIAYIQTNATLILDKYDLRNAKSIVNPEGKSALSLLVNRFDKLYAKILLLRYEKQNSPLRPVDSVAESIDVDYSLTGELLSGAVSALRRAWLANNFDRKYGDYLLYLNSYSGILLDELDLRNYSFVLNPAGKMVMVSIMSKMSNTGIKVIQTKFGERNTKYAGDIAEIIRMSITTVRNSEDELNRLLYLDWHTAQYGQSYFYLRYISGLSLAQFGRKEPIAPQEIYPIRENIYNSPKLDKNGLEAVKSLINSLSPFEQRILVFKYSKASYGEIRVANPTDADRAFMQAKSFIDSSWSSAVLSKYGNQYDFVRAVSDSEFGQDILKKTKDVTGW